MSRIAVHVSPCFAEIARYLSFRKARRFGVQVGSAFVGVILFEPPRYRADNVATLAL